MKDLMGLAVLFWPLTLMAAFVLAFTLAVSGTYFATRKKKSGWKWPLAVAVLLYLAVFWDHIPTVLAHKYYCETEAGFWVYKTLGQWKAENPGGMETLVANKGAPSERQGDMQNYKDTYFLNQRFNWVVKHNGKLPLNRWRHEQEVIDNKSNQVLARYIDFSTSQEQPQAGWSGWKFWLANEHCAGGEIKDSRMWQFTKSFKGAEK